MKHIKLLEGFLNENKIELAQDFLESFIRQVLSKKFGMEFGWAAEVTGMEAGEYNLDRYSDGVFATVKLKDDDYAKFNDELSKDYKTAAADFEKFVMDAGMNWGTEILTDDEDCLVTFKLAM